MSDCAGLQEKSGPPGWAEAELACPVRKISVRVKRFYHFFSRGCCSTYSYLSGAFCEHEPECRQRGVYDQCPLIREMAEQDDR